VTTTRALAPLRHPAFRLLSGGQLASSVGDAFYAVALPWYVLAEHGGALLLGTVLAAYGVPRTALMLFGGHASDRWRPWRVMMVADIMRAGAVGAFAIVAASGPARAVSLLPVAVVLGAGEGLFLPGSLAIVPSLLPEEELQAGNSLSTGVMQVANLGGPVLGGVVVGLAGPAPAFATDAVSFAISALSLAGIALARRKKAAVSGAGTGVDLDARATRDRQLASSTGALAGPAPAPAPAAEQAPVQAATGGAAPTTPTLSDLLRNERVVQVIFLVVLAANLGSGGLGSVALPALAHGPLHTGSTGYGALFAAEAAGGLIGTLLAAQSRQRARPAVLASGVFLVEAVVIGVLPYFGSAFAVGASLAVMGLLNSFGNIVILTLFQRWAPPGALGRLVGLVMFAAFGTYPISVALGGLVVRDFGPKPFFPAAGAIVGLAVLAALSQREWRDLGLDRAAGAAAPSGAALRQPLGRAPDGAAGGPFVDLVTPEPHAEEAI